MDPGGVQDAPRREEGLDLVEEDDAGGLVPGLPEDLLRDPLALPHPLGEDVCHADVEEGHGVLRRDGPDHEGLPAAGRAVEEDAPRRLEVHLLEELLLLEGEDDHVLDALDGLVQAADHAVGHAGPLAQQEALHLRVGHDLQDLHGGGEEGDLVARLDGLGRLGVALDDALLQVALRGDNEGVLLNLLNLPHNAPMKLLGPLHDGVGLGVDPHVLADAELVLVHEAGGDLQHLAGSGHHDLVAGELLPLLPDDVRVEEGRLLDLVELVLVGLEPVVPLLDLVPEVVELPLVLVLQSLQAVLQLLGDLSGPLLHLLFEARVLVLVLGGHVAPFHPWGRRAS